MSIASPRSVHLVGSVPLADADAVFKATSEILGSRIRRLPDGETGPRRNWINFQYCLLARHPQFEFDGPAIDPDIVVLESHGEGADYGLPTQLRPKPGIGADDLHFDGLGYRDAALDSYRRFSALKATGTIARDARFMVALPTPLAPVALFVSAPHIFTVLPAYGAALMAEAQAIVAAIPAPELAVQWDVAVEFGLWEGLFPPPPGDWQEMLLGQLAQLGDAIPEGVEMGYHLCYGDRGHRHFIEPKDTGNLVEVANGIAARLKRHLDWLHLPVPRNRSDAAYFAPLEGLALKPRTELYLGLVHRTDGVEGTRRRIAEAAHHVADFGIAAECGLGRRDPATILDFLRVHAAAAT
jgi:hypothetical protein